MVHADFQHPYIFVLEALKVPIVNLEVVVPLVDAAAGVVLNVKIEVHWN